MLSGARLSLPLADTAAWAELAVFVNSFKEGKEGAEHLAVLCT